MHVPLVLGHVGFAREGFVNFPPSCVPVMPMNESEIRAQVAEDLAPAALMSPQRFRLHEHYCERFMRTARTITTALIRVVYTCVSETLKTEVHAFFRS